MRLQPGNREFGTGFVKREDLIGTEVGQKWGLGSLFIYYLYYQPVGVFLAD